MTMDNERSLGRVLAVDYGTVRLGLAVSDYERQFASPYENYTRVNLTQDARYLKRVIQEERIVQLVVGLPIHLDGRESQKSIEARQFADWLGELSSLPVDLMDERFTSYEAEQFLIGANLSRAKRKERLDKLAAQILLAAYLETPAESRSLPPKGLS